MVFGTWVDISIADVEPELARRGIADLGAYFQEMHSKWHAWDPGEMTALNQAFAEGRGMAVDESLRTLIGIGTRLEANSDGLFNPAIGRLIGLWGFHSSERPSKPPPPAETVAALVRAAPSMAQIHIDGATVRSDNPAVQLDLGGFAKGYAVDWAIDHLKSLGVHNAIVNAGGDLRAIGSKSGKPWQIGVRHPQGEGVLATIAVQGDESVFTSGNYVRYNEFEGIRYPHIIDPRTGQPGHGVTSVTVIQHNSAEADAAATALVVAGPSEWHRIAKQMGIRYVLLVDEAGTVHVNPAMLERVHFSGQTPTLAVSDPL